MIYEYTDYREFLKYVLAQRVAKNPKYSLRAMAKSFAISPALLSQIGSGHRNLTMTNALRLTGKLGLSQRESDYFCSLVQFQDAKHMESKAILLEKINSMRARREVHNISVDAFQAMSEWYHFAIVELMNTKGFKASPKTVAKRLGISAIEAEVALERLVRLGMIEERQGGGYRKTRAVNRVECAQKSQALQTFHRQLLEKAIVALSAQSPEERYVGSETFAIDESLLPEARKRVNQFLDDMSALADRGANKTEVYHLGVQLFRLTRKEEG